MIGGEIWACGDVSVWSFDLQAEPGVQNRNLLSVEEKSRADRFRQAGHKARYEGAHAALRWRLSGLHRRSPLDLVFRRGAWGKPDLEDTAGHRFSLSYRDDVALVATSLTLEVGVDVDSLEGLQDLDGTACEIMTGAEYESWRATPVADRQPALLRCWTRKEAVLKAIGTGLSVDPKSVFVSHCADRGSLEVSFNGYLASLDVCSFPVGARHVGAIAIVRDLQAVHNIAEP